MTEGEPHASASGIVVSVVCPFFNEEAIVEQAVTALLARLEELEHRWELIVVNDGSRDASGAIVEELCRRHPRLRMIDYPVNRGRGYALRRGISEARGEVIVTTEIDLSWGEDIVERLLAVMLAHPECDVVVASPNLEGGGYKNVPWNRVLVSRMGNWVVRACMTGATTMNTGMTRAYRREVIQSMPLEENGKEFHLEVILKAQALRCNLLEIPCVLEWKDYKQKGRKVQRKSSSRVKRLIVSHSLFSLFANPIRYFWTASIATGLTSLGFLIAAIVFLFRELETVYLLIVSLSMAIISMVFFTLGVIAHQGHALQKEIWTLKRTMLLQELRRREAENEPGVAPDRR